MKKSRVSVFVRIRPSQNALAHTETTIAVARNKRVHEFAFDKVFGPGARTSEIYKHVAISAKTTILCYGNTSSGKSHTMTGNARAKGLVHMAAETLLRSGGIRVAYFEIYKESVRCLFTKRDVRLRESGGATVADAAKVEVGTYAEFVCALARGNAHRATGATGLNAASSRSHAVLELSTDACVVRLVDLAGSEDNRKTGNVGARMAESSSINSSLFVLGKVVKAVANGDARVPYRDSKLTRVLSDCIGGDAATFLVCNVCSDAEFAAETLRTLNFASLSAKIVNALAEKSGNVAKKRTENELLLTPDTKRKSCTAFERRAQRYELAGHTKKALADYRTLERIGGCDGVREKIRALSRSSPKKEISAPELLEILNSRDFVRTKSLSGVGDKRAQRIIEHVAAGNAFASASDLRALFSQKVVDQICAIKK